MRIGKNITSPAQASLLWGFTYSIVLAAEKYRKKLIFNFSVYELSRKRYIIVVANFYHLLPNFEGFRKPLAAVLYWQGKALSPSLELAVQRQQSAPILGDCKGYNFILLG